MSGIRWTEDELRAWQIKSANRSPVPTADKQSTAAARAGATDENKKVHTRYRVCILQRRKRLVDTDGVNIKAAIDGLVCGGLLPDDSPQRLESILVTQEKSATETTEIEIWEVE